MRVAKAKADAMLNQVGQTTGKVLFVTDQQVDVYYPRMEMANTMMKIKEINYNAVDNNLGFDAIKIQQRIHVRFEAK